MIERGAECKILRGPLGALAHPDATHFEPETVRPGARATYVGPHPTLPGWHTVIAAAFPAGEVQSGAGRPLFVPVNEAQFEVIA